MKKHLLTVIVLLAGFLSQLEAQRINIPGDYSTIQEGIDIASNGDTILVAEGTYIENIDFNSKVLTVASQFIIDGDTSHISKTIIDGSNSLDPLKASVVTITGVPVSQATLTGFTITGGTGTYLSSAAATYGGGIFILGCGAVIEHNLIKNNVIDQPNCSASGIGAILSENDTLRITQNSCIGNVVISSEMTAGAIACRVAKNATVRINDNIISKNIAINNAPYKAVGGGLYIETEYSFGADIQVYNNIIDHNELHCQSSHGGGIYVVFSGKSPSPVPPSQVHIYNNVITDNYSQDVGGGIAIWNFHKQKYPSSNFPPDPVLINNTITNNVASDGSGIFNYDATTILINNILWDSITSESCREIFQDSIVDYDFCPDPCWPVEPNRGILYLYNNCIKGGWKQGWEKEWQGTWEGEGNIDADPWFEDDSFNLSDSSFCVGNGRDSVEIEGAWYAIPEFDPDNNPRPNSIDEYPDIGALESPYFKNDPPVALKNVIEINEGFDVYPNPSTNLINLRLNSHGDYYLSIISVTGQVIRSEEFTRNEHWVDLSGIRDGIYFVTVRTDKNVWIHKVVKY